MIRAHQPGSLPIDVPETIPNPAVPETIPNPAVPETTPAPTKPIPQEPVKTPEKVPANCAPAYAGAFSFPTSLPNRFEPEMRQSVRIMKQCLEKLRLPEGQGPVERDPRTPLASCA
jgi:hypothetical protein